MTDRGRVLVAGSGGGIGQACVRRLAADGYDIIGVDRVGGVDVARPGGAEQAVADVGDPLRGVVHAIGMSGRRFGDGPVTECTDEAWGEVLRVNLESAFRLLRVALPTVEPGGSVVVVGSVLARRSDPDFVTAAYAASKAGLEGLVRVTAREASQREVRVNCVAAGLVDTPMAARALSDPRIAGRLPELQPLGGRAVAPDEVAGAVAWLLSDDAAAVTGACIPVDRGWLL
jgi:NAD(P)-dependent dehydrogenase (short-subunit alcohol dehydrogenase family)